MGKNDRKDSLESPSDLEDFLRGVESKGAVKIDIRHLVSGKEQADAIAEVEKEIIADEDEERFNGDDIYQKIVCDAEQYGGIQRYRLLAFRANSKSILDSKGFKIDGGAENEGVGTEAMGNPLQAALALLSQSHRHNEALMRSVETIVSRFIADSRAQTSSLASMVDKLTAERGEVFELLGTIHKTNNDKLLIQAEIESEAKKQDVLAGVIKLLTPAIAIKFGLKTEEVKESVVSQFVQSLSDDQQKTIFGVLTPEQQAALWSLIDKQVKKEGGNNGS